MADIQVTQEVIVELNNFYNVDLFQRGYYQIRCHVESPAKLTSVTECELKQEAKGKSIPCLFQAFVDKHNSHGISKTFEVYYKHEDILIKDRFVFKLDMLVDGSKLETLVPQKLNVVLELYFTECSRKHPATPKSLEHVSTQTVTLNLYFGKCFHAHRPILFDYFHFGALTVTIHSCVIAFRQPWSAGLKGLHPIWSGKSGNIRNYCYNALFGKGPPMAPSHKLDNRQKDNATFLHRRLCLQLLQLYEQVLMLYHIAIECLPDSQQTRLSNVDINAKLNVLNNEFLQLATAEEHYLRMGDDLYLLSTELSMLWLQFMDQFSFEGFFTEKLALEHHKARTELLKEAFFTEEHPWLGLCTSIELSTSQQLRMSNSVKNSLYYQLIPPLSLHCAAIDGDNSTTPIIFEDKFIPGKKEGDEDLKRANSVSVTVEESIVCDGFVDMDVSIEDSEGHVKNLSSEFGTMGVDPHNDEEEQFVTMGVDADNNEDEQFVTQTVEIDNEIHRKSALIGRYRSVTEEWKERKETQDGEIKTVASAKTEIADVDDVNKENSIFYEKHQKLFKKNSSSIFYTPLNEKENANSSKEPSLAEDTLEIERMENYFDDEDSTSLKLACHGPQSLNSQNLIKQPPSPGEPVKSNLWSCFPAIKKGSSKRSSYKMTFASPPYMPAGKDQSSRFEKARQNLQVGCNFPGHHYSLYNDEAKVKPYFQEKIVATTENVHLVVCVHGLDGNSGDLRLVKCYLEMALPRANFDFMMSEVNQDDTFCDINEMTDKLVREILDYIDDQKIDVIRLSFVGHSLGNIIIRNAVANSKLFQYRNKLHTFLSLSGPHLGMQFHTSNLVSTGMWLMQKWKKNGSLVQLALNDSSNPRETFMYHLSLTNGFQYFKNVLLVSSVQDHYVPFHSARLEMSKQVVKDNTDGARVYKEMLDNIMNPLLIQEEINIVRYSIYHPMATSANTFIGRAAHIAMLDSELFLEKFILITASKYFR